MNKCEKWKLDDPGWFGVYGHYWGNVCLKSSGMPQNLQKENRMKRIKYSTPMYSLEVACQKTCRTCSERRITKGKLNFFVFSWRTYFCSLD